LTYDAIGLLLSVVFVLVAFFGTRVYKKITKYSLVVKWASAGFMILFAIIAACVPSHPLGSSSNAQYWATHSSINLSNFLGAFCACFYYFTGFEAFASAGSTVKEPEKNIGKGIMIVMFASTLFYILITFLFMMAQSEFIQNINTGF
jgi:amino acid transporter